MSIKGRNNNNNNTYYFLILTILVGFITTSFVYCDGDNTSLSLQESNDRNEKFAKFQLDLVKNIASTKDVNKLKIMLEQALNEISTTTTAETIVGEGKSLNMLKDKPIVNVVAVIGGGLSGLTASLRLLEKGKRVLLIEKQPFMGGNSAKASSGINGCTTEKQKSLGIDDKPDILYKDTMDSSKRADNSFTGKLVRRMADDSKTAVEWIASRSNVELPDVGQLGGHSQARTHRPRGRLAGAAFISGLERNVMKYSKGDDPLLTVLKGYRLIGMEEIFASSYDNNNNNTIASNVCDENDDKKCINNDDDDKNENNNNLGWALTLKREQTQQKLSSSNNEEYGIKVSSVILATGGYANDKGEHSLLNEVAPQLQTLGSTNGKFATGDGIKLGRAIGAETIDLDMVQVHPTGFSDVPKGFMDEGSDRSLILCAEIVRGAGAVLIEKHGKRFIDELKTRKEVVNVMNSLKQEKFVIAVPPHAAPIIDAHIQIYSGKGLLNPVEGYEGVANYVKERLNEDGKDEMILSNLKKTFQDTTNNLSSIDRKVSTKLPLKGRYYVGIVEPVLHYTMGGLMVNPNGAVLNKKNETINNLYAAGEIMGGVHGENRLGGSSLLDCVVFGLAAANSIITNANEHFIGEEETVKSNNNNRILSIDDGLQLLTTTGNINHVKEQKNDINTGVSSEKRIHAIVKDRTYDLTEFIPIHPGGPIHVKHGEDLTKRFVQAHGNDFDLFDRDTIKEINIGENGKIETKKREKKFFEEYGSKGGSWREFIGRRAWFVLHSFAAKYPEHPSPEDRQAMTNLIAAFGQLYPCKLCRKHLQQQLREPSLGPPRVENRRALSTWICELHNMVNADIGKPQIDCNPFKIDLMYLKDCGGCEVKPKGGDKGIVVDETKRSGYHAPTGPWDAEIYRRDPALLQTVKGETDAWETKDLVELVDAMDVMRKWFRVFKKKEIKKLKKEIHSVSKRKIWMKKMDEIFKPVITKLKGTKLLEV